MNGFYASSVPLPQAFSSLAELCPRPYTILHAFCGDVEQERVMVTFIGGSPTLTSEVQAIRNARTLADKSASLNEEQFRRKLKAEKLAHMGTRSNATLIEVWEEEALAQRKRR